MQPKPIADTSRPLLPSLRFCICFSFDLVRLTPTSGAGNRRLLWREFAVPVGRRDSTIHEEVAARDKSTVRAHEERTDGSDLVRGSGPAGWAQIDHAPVARATGTGQFVLGERGDDDAWADGVHPRKIGRA